MGRIPVAERVPFLEPGSLVVLYPEDLWTAKMYQAAYPALLAGTIAAGVAVAITTLLARRLVRPIREVGVQTAAIARGDFTRVAVSRRNDEIRDLAESINRMTERLAQYEGEVRRNERLRLLGQLGAGMAHQLRNAATGGRMAIELHQRHCPIGPKDEPLDVALRQLRLMESYLQRFLSLGGPPSAARESVDIERLIEDVLALVRPACAHAGIDLQFNRPSQPLHLHGDSEALRQLLVNLALNAVEAAGGEVGARSRILITADRAGQGRGTVCVQDSGPGPSDEVQGRLFEPFVTGKPEGIGLGLFVARQIAEAHRGQIAWHRRDGMTCFTFEFPLLSESDRGPLVGRG